MTPTRTVALIVAIVVATTFFALPPRRQSLTPETSASPFSLRGAFHIHTRRSDGTGTVEQVAAAAARSGLQFVVLTDHGDATQMDSPIYLSGVLCIDAVEISTDGGHLIGIGLPRTPYPLGGEPRDVIEDIRRFGGVSIAAHPDSGKRELQWTDFTLPFDGLEWLNGDSEWRDESLTALGRVLLTYWFRSPESLATLLDRPSELLSRWDALTRQRQVVALAGSDAHARIGLSGIGEPYGNSVALPVPSYDQIFRTFSISVPGVRLGGSAFDDAHLVVDAIRQGHVYSSIDGFATPGTLQFSAVSGEARAEAGDLLTMNGSDDAIALRAETNAPDAQITLYKDGEPVSSMPSPVLEYKTPPGPGTYRVEVELRYPSGGRRMPWVVSNPIYAVMAPSAISQQVSRPSAKDFASQYENGKAAGWTIEKSSRAAGALDVARAVGGGEEIAMRYALGGVASENPFVAFIMPAGPLAEYDRLLFTARANRPMRMSVQLRSPNPQGGERWHRSVYLDEMPRDVAIAFDDLRPRGEPIARRPVLSDVQSVLFVIDRVNTALGTNGQIWLDDVRYGR